MSVRTIMDKSGISSAQNLQITALAVSGIGITDTHMTQPTKKLALLLILMLFFSFNTLLVKSRFTGLRQVYHIR